MSVSSNVNQRSSCVYVTCENCVDVDGLTVLHSDGLTWNSCLDVVTSHNHVSRRPRTPPTIPGDQPRLCFRNETWINVDGHQHILRLLNTNVDGKRKVMYALTEIKGVGRRYSNIVCKKADVDLNKRWVVLKILRRSLTITVAAPVSSTRMNSNALSPSSKTPPNSRSQRGS